MEVESEADEADITAAPGDSINVSIPNEVSQADGVEHVELSGLPDGASVQGAIDNGDGSYTVSGNLEQSVEVTLDESFSGEFSMDFQGFDDLDNALPDASTSLSVEVDDQYAMQASDKSGSDPVDPQSDGGATDWTSVDGSVSEIDFTDDSSSHDTGNGGNDNQFNDLDNNL